ncbi:MAG: integrase core domain-containing protein [Sphingomonas sp.]
MRDNDGAYGLTFHRRVRAMGIRDRPTAPHSPWQNGHVERLIGSIRRECLDHLVIIVSAAHLRHVLQAMRVTTTKTARTWRWTRMRPGRGPSRRWAR